MAACWRRLSDVTFWAATYWPIGTGVLCAANSKKWTYGKLQMDEEYCSEITNCETIQWNTRKNNSKIIYLFKNKNQFSAKRRNSTVLLRNKNTRTCRYHYSTTLNTCSIPGYFSFTKFQGAYFLNLYSLCVNNPSPNAGVRFVKDNAVCRTKILREIGIRGAVASIHSLYLKDQLLFHTAPALSLNLWAFEFSFYCHCKQRLFPWTALIIINPVICY